MIRHHIRVVNSKRVIFPVIFAAITIYLLINTPFFKAISPTPLNSINNIQSYYAKNNNYIIYKADELYYTGYDYYKNGHMEGSYYYCIENGICTFFLLPTSDTNNTSNIINYVSIRARLDKNSEIFDTLLNSVASDLNWTTNSLKAVTNSVLVNEVEYYNIKNILLMSVLVVGIIIYIIIAITFLSHVFFPTSTAYCIKLKKYGKPSAIISEAEAELTLEDTLVLGKTYITEHYVVNFSKSGVSILPLSELIWAHYHSVFNYKFLNIRSKVQFTMIVCANKGVTVYFSHKTKEEVIDITNILKERCPELITGYSHENRKLAHKVLTDRKKSSKEKHTES